MTLPAILSTLVANARTAAASETPGPAIREVLAASLASQEAQDAMADAITTLSDDDTMLFEDDSVSIWTCRYADDIVFAPHNHLMPAHIAVYRGAEVEVLYKREVDDNGAPVTLRHGGNKVVQAGDIITLGTNAIHAITSQPVAGYDGKSLAIHIYEGPLSTIERHLFDWTTGAPIPMTLDAFYDLARKKADMAEFVSA